MKVYLIRHGLTDAILDGLYCGSTDVPVNKRGLVLLKQNSKKDFYPSENRISLFVTSRMIRTKQTLAAIFGDNTKAIAIENFNELDFGEYEMKTDSELSGDEGYKNWIENYIVQSPPCGESVDDLWKRMIEGFEHINTIYKGAGDVLIVSHGITIATVLHKLFAFPLLLSIPQPGEGYAVELGFEASGHLLPSSSRFCNRISDLEKNLNLWKKPTNFSYFTNKKSKITILHSNDLHGQFLFKANPDCTLQGGISLLNGYIKEARQEDSNIIFTISGDIMEKRLLDKSVKGINAVDICNYLSPDIISIGNHELSYGISELLLFEKCTDFPIINANIYTNYLQKPLLQPFYIKTIKGIRIMFIGVLDEPMFQKMPISEFEQDALEYRETLSQIKMICGMYKTPDIDMVILLSHIGLDKDRQLARDLPAECGVNIILGGHSHIIMEQPVIENGIIIVQSAYGTDYIGRLEIEFDHQKQTIGNTNWELVSINSETSQFDKEYDFVSDRILDSRCSDAPEIICTFEQRYRHEKRYECTDLGRLIVDSYLEIYAVDMIWFPSKNIRTESCGPKVTYMNLLQMLPYDGGFVCIVVTGAKIIQLLEKDFPKNPQEVYSIPIQYSKGFEIIYDCKSGELEVTFNGENLKDNEKKFVLGMPTYVYDRFEVYFGEEADDTRFKKRVLSNSMLADLVAYFKNAVNPIKADPISRLTYYNREYQNWNV